jgi:hypothetical protein
MSARADDRIIFQICKECRNDPNILKERECFDCDDVPENGIMVFDIDARKRVYKKKCVDEGNRHLIALARCLRGVDMWDMCLDVTFLISEILPAKINSGWYGLRAC